MNYAGDGQDESIEAVAAQLDEMVRAFEGHPDAQVQRDVFTLLQQVDTLHRTALTRLIVSLRAAGGDAALASASDDPTVRLLLELYDLLPGDDPAPVEFALEGARPYLAAHGVHVKLVGVADGVVRLRITGPTSEDPTMHVPPREVLEVALRQQFPALQRIEVQTAAAILPSNIIPLMTVSPKAAPPAPPPRERYAVGDAADVPDGTMQPVVVRGNRLLLCNVGGDIYALAENCPGSALPLSAGVLVEGELRCPWHDCRFDVRTGARTGGVGPDLERLPVIVVDGALSVELPARATVPGDST